MLAVVCSAGVSRADETEAAAMVVSTSDGHSLSVNLTDDWYASGFYVPKSGDVRPINFYMYTGEVSIDWETGNPVFGENGGTIVFEMPVADISDISFVGLSPVSVNEKVVTDIMVNVGNGTVSVTRVTTPVVFTVHDINGTLLYSETLSGDCVISLDRFGSGVRLCRVGNQSFKILVR